MPFSRHENVGAGSPENISIASRLRLYLENKWLVPGASVVPLEPFQEGTHRLSHRLSLPNT